MGQTYSQIFPPKPKWTPDQMDDLSGKVIIVTGGNTGIGFETCKVLFFTCKNVNSSDTDSKMNTQAFYLPFSQSFFSSNWFYMVPKFIWLREHLRKGKLQWKNCEN